MIEYIVRWQKSVESLDGGRGCWNMTRERIILVCVFVRTCVILYGLNNGDAVAAQHEQCDILFCSIQFCLADLLS